MAFNQHRITQYHTIYIEDLPDGVEDWMAGWNEINDGYTSLQLSRLVEDSRVANDETRQWVTDFLEAFPGTERILVYVSY